MLFLKIDSWVFQLSVLLVIIFANGLGIIARIKPIRNPILHSLHHIFYFLVILISCISILHSYLLSLPFAPYIFLLVLMSILPFVKKGRIFHILIGLSALFAQLFRL